MRTVALHDSLATFLLQFIGGHGDVTLGMLAIKGQALAQRLYFLQVAVPPCNLPDLASPGSVY